MVVSPAPVRPAWTYRLLRQLTVAARQRAHAVATGHPVVRSFEPGEAWFWNYQTEEGYDDGPALASPEHHPLDQPVPGPAGRTLSDWQAHLH